MHITSVILVFYTVIVLLISLWKPVTFYLTVLTFSHRIAWYKLTITFFIVYSVASHIITHQLHLNLSLCVCVVSHFSHHACVIEVTQHTQTLIECVSSDTCVWSTSCQCEVSSQKAHFSLALFSECDAVTVFLSFCCGWSVSIIDQVHQLFTVCCSSRLRSNIGHVWKTSRVLLNCKWTRDVEQVILCLYQARQLKKKENELKHLEQFYKEQLHLMEKKVWCTNTCFTCWPIYEPFFIAWNKTVVLYLWGYLQTCPLEVQRLWSYCKCFTSFLWCVQSY